MDMDPSFDGRNSVVQWTAPAAGAYRINGRFEGIDHVSTDVSLLLNDNAASPLITGSLNGLGSQAPFGFVRTLAAGDRLQFVVNPRGNVFSDGTGLSVTIILEGSLPDDGAVEDSGSLAINRATYDPNFNQLTSRSDELGRQTIRALDPANGNALTVTQVVGTIGGNDDVATHFTYTEAGQIDTVTDPLGRVTKQPTMVWGDR